MDHSVQKTPKKAKTQICYVPSQAAKAILDALPPREKTEFINAAIIAQGGEGQDQARARLKILLMKAE